MKKIILSLHFWYFKMFYINKNQTFSYQLMIIFMYIHYLKRLRLIESFSYIGKSEFKIKAEIDELKELFIIVKRFISPQYKRLLVKDEFDTLLKQTAFIVSLLKEIENEEKNEDTKDSFFELKLENAFITFKVKNKGLSYQYNGYKKSEVKMANKANLFALLTVFGASFLWIETKPEIINNLLFGYIGLIIIYSLIFLLYILRKKFILPFSKGAFSFFVVVITIIISILFYPRYKSIFNLNFIGSKVEDKKEEQTRYKPQIIININEINIKKSL